MIDGVALITSSIQQDMLRLNVIANNAANVMTPGFKRELLASIASPGNTIGVLGLALPLGQSNIFVDMKSGVVKKTGGSLDLAIQGEGFFEVSTDKGLQYSRHGSFHLNDKGVLVNVNGNSVAGMGGEIVLSDHNVTIDRQGKIYERGKQVAQIKLTKFTGTNALMNVGGGMLMATENAEKSVIDRPALVQGAIESSNVDSAHEMVKMIDTYRHFEASTRVLQAYDDLNDKVLRNLSQF